MEDIVEISLTKLQQDKRFTYLSEQLILEAEALADTADLIHIRKINNILITILENEGMSGVDAKNFILSEW